MDEILKMLFGLSDRLTVGMINSLFGRDFPPDAKVTLANGELHRFGVLEQAIDELRVDMLLNINGENFHLEFQTALDCSMPLRMFEYGFTISIQEVKSLLRQADGVLTMTYPKQFVIFVEEDGAVPEHGLTMRVTLWDGDVKEYKVPLLRYWEETVESLGEKQLEPLLPLQVFNIRKSLEKIAKPKLTDAEKERLTEEKLHEVVGIYKSVAGKIKSMTEEEGKLTLSNAKQMLEALYYLSSYLYDRYGGYQKVEKEAKEMAESIFVFDQWIKEGVQKGRMETAHDMFMDGENIAKKEIFQAVGQGTGRCAEYPAQFHTGPI
jgi:hypothetical protein